MDFETEDKLATLRSLLKALDEHAFQIAAKQGASADRIMNMQRLGRHINKLLDKMEAK